jgi:hypothetical protein
MKLKINYLKEHQKTENEKEDVIKAQCNTWKRYESEQMDDDMKVCTVSHMVDRAILDDVQITCKKQVDDLMEFLRNLKPSLRC